MIYEVQYNVNLIIHLNNVDNVLNIRNNAL